MEEADKYNMIGAYVLAHKKRRRALDLLRELHYELLDKVEGYEQGDLCKWATQILSREKAEDIDD